MDASPGCNIDVSHLGGSCQAALVGELDLASVEAVESALRPLRPRYEARQVVLDCSRLSFIGAVGLNQLVEFARSWGDSKGKVTLRGASPLMRRMMAITNTEKFFEIDGAGEQTPSRM